MKNDIRGYYHMGNRFNRIISQWYADILGDKSQLFVSDEVGCIEFTTRVKEVFGDTDIVNKGITNTKFIYSLSDYTSLMNNLKDYLNEDDNKDGTVYIHTRRIVPNDIVHLANSNNIRIVNYYQLANKYDYVKAVK